jgi:protein-S-isoprenylcysteine O-methyltransferase Ste14
MKQLFIAGRALVFMTAFIYFWYWCALQIARAYPSWPLPSWTVVPGMCAILVGGIAIILSAGAQVLIGLGTPAPFDPPRRLVVLGPYRYTRNPMYIGAFLTLIGLALSLHSGTVLTFAVIWVLGVHAVVRLYEEPVLRHTFGAPYEDYCRCVPRWVGRSAARQLGLRYARPS